VKKVKNGNNAEHVERVKTVKGWKRPTRVAKAGLVLASVGLACACAEPVVAWVPLIGAAGLVFKTTQSRNAAAAAKPATPVERTSLADFEVLQARGTVFVVDVRNDDSFRAGHIPGAMNVPIDELERRTAEIIARAGSFAIVTYCSCVNEHTSAIAAEVFNKAGACRATALAGGYPAWVAGGRKVERGAVSSPRD
jgi:rhodanese-related sulfurtransferase